MKHDQLAFVNLQLAGMLKSGIPLEGALRQLCATLRRGSLRTELEGLESDLAAGTPLHEALTARRLPDLYRQMILVGVQSNDLPGVLILLADHYQRVNSIGTRLKGLMVYPAIVLLASLALSFFLALFFRSFTEDMPKLLTELSAKAIVGRGSLVMLWTPVVVLSLAAGLVLLGFLLPAFRRWLRWHLPGFKDAGLAQVASALRLMLKSGTHLGEALGLLRNLESKTPVGQDLARWQTRLAEGHARFPEIAAGSKVVPPLFSWLVSSSSEDMADGFGRAAEIYQARAAHRIEMWLYAALPVSILFLGGILLSQAYPLMRLFAHFGALLDQLGQ